MKLQSLISGIKSFLRDEEGATAVEYGVLVALIATAIVAIVYFVGQQVRNAFQQVCEAMKNVTNASCS